MATTPEGKVKAKLDKRLKALQAKGHPIWWFNPQSGIYGRAGVPDKILCVDGQFIGVEVKADNTKRPTRLQEQCMTKITEAGGICWIVYNDETIEALAAWLRMTLTRVSN